LCIESYKTGGKKLKKTHINGKRAYFVDWKLNTIKISILPKAIYIDAILVKIPMSFFMDIKKKLNFLCKHRRP
jgi:hypothetical protein